MTRRILQLIIVGIVLTSQLSLGLADEEDSTQALVNSDSAITQYLLGVIEYKEGNVELAKVWFQRAYESLEAEESKIGVYRRQTPTKTQAFRRALLNESLILAAPAKVQFPEGYKVNVYYRDGWYTQPKDPLVGKKQVYSFLPGSTYKIRVEAENAQPAHKRINIGMKVVATLVMISWMMAR